MISLKVRSGEVNTITVRGCVENPGEHIVGNRGLLNALIVAGGICRGGTSHVDVIGKTESYRVGLIDILEEHKDDIWVPPGWIIVVPKQYVMGIGDLLNDDIKDYLIERGDDQQKEYDMLFLSDYNDEKSVEEIEEKP